MLNQRRGHVLFGVMPPRDATEVFRALTTPSLDHLLPLLARDFDFLAFLKRQPYKMPP